MKLFKRNAPPYETLYHYFSSFHTLGLPTSFVVIYRHHCRAVSAYQVLGARGEPSLVTVYILGCSTTVPNETHARVGSTWIAFDDRLSFEVTGLLLPFSIILIQCLIIFSEPFVIINRFAILPHTLLTRQA